MNQQTHLKDHKKISLKLPLIIVSFVILIIIGFLTMREPERKFVVSVDDMQKAVLQRNETIKPEEVLKIINSADESYRFIDLRNPHDFIKGHIKGAINIPKQYLLADEYDKLIKDTSKINILYAKTHDEACGPWMILKQLGFNNNRILLGGYSYYSKTGTLAQNISPKDYLDEKPKYDYAKVVKSVSGSAVIGSSKKKKKIKIKRKKKKKGAEGGC